MSYSFTQFSTVAKTYTTNGTRTVYIFGDNDRTTVVYVFFTTKFVSVLIHADVPKCKKILPKKLKLHLSDPDFYANFLFGVIYKLHNPNLDQTSTTPSETKSPIFIKF